MSAVNRFFLFVLFTTVLSSCSKSSSPAAPAAPAAQTFKVNNEIFDLPPANGLVIQNTAVNLDTNLPAIQSNFTVIGLIGTTKTATISFPLFRKSSQSIAGTYMIFDALNGTSISPDFGAFVQTNNRACLGWPSACQVTENATSSFLIRCNNPVLSSTITIIDNGSNNYSVKFNGNFRQYSSTAVQTGTVPVEVNITTTAIVN